MQYGGGAGYNEYGQNTSRVGDHDMRVVDRAQHGDGVAELDGVLVPDVGELNGAFLMNHRSWGDFVIE